jgi:hypothetical protein
VGTARVAAVADHAGDTQSAVGEPVPPVNLLVGEASRDPQYPAAGQYGFF